MKFIYMNHRIRDPKTKGPVIVVQESTGMPGSFRVREANEFEIQYRGQPIGRVVFSPDGLPVCDTHEVRAWVELFADVDVVAVSKASAKKPNTKVKV